MSGEFVISLDFELLWGVRDHATRDTYGANVLGGRAAIPRILDLFERYGIRATWATVGLLMAESRDELMASLPPEDLRPRYDNPRLSSYSYLDEVGEDERRDPYYYGMSLVRRIMDCPGQEIGTHTHTSYYPLESGPTIAHFEADLTAAIAMAQRRNLVLRSIVFPRNQYDAVHLAACAQQGILAHRGNETCWPYRATPVAQQTLPRRALRLADAHTGVLGDKTFLRTQAPGQGGQTSDVRASQFLRPRAGALRVIHPLHVRTIKRALTQAAQTARGYHLWWHPHNFGLKMADNLAALSDILAHFQKLAHEHGMVSRAMSPPQTARPLAA
jgi:peptidoglycan/xylan/chitin deacetylase (PgdA/CDA1 family)